MSALALLLAVLASISTAGEQTAVAVFKTRFVPPRRVDVSKAKELPDLAGVWIWTTDTPPQRTDASLKTAPAQSASLTVRIETSVTPPNDLALVAAPAAMWEEVPEPLLPATKVEFGKDQKAVVHVPVDAKTPWRLRLKGSASGSWWIDVPPGQHQTTLGLVAAPDHAIEVRGDDGKPVAEAAVTVLEEGTLRGDFRKLADFRTDERGRLLFAGLPDSASPTILFGAAGWAPNVYITKPSRIPAIVTLRRGHRVTGNVRNRSGAPVAGASIEVRAPIAPTVPALLHREAKSDAEGRWEAAALPDGEGSWEIAAPAFATVTGRVKFDKDVVDLGTITLEPGVKVEVQVNDDRGVPVAGAGIYTGDRTLATTNEKGHATVTLAPKESILMRAGAKHYHFAAKTVRATDRLVTFVLTRLFRITGRFVDSAGLPVMDTKVSAHRENLSVFPNDSRIDDGRFDLELDSDGEYELELSSSRTSTARVHVKPGALGEVRDLGDIVAPSALTVTGRLLRAGDALPVAGAHVWALRPSPEGIVESWSLRNIAETTSAADGTFTLTGLPLQSPFDLRVDAPSLAPIRKSFTPAAASDHVNAGDITLAAGATVVIRLQNDTGEDASGRVHTGGMFFSREPLNAPFENGVARVTGVPPGPALVSASRRRDILCQQKVTIPESGDDVEIICNARKVTIAGTVTVGGSPAGRGTIVWRQGPHDFQSAMQDPYFSPDHPQETVDVGADGRFEGPRLLPGVWDVMWMPELGREYAPKTITVTDIDVQNVTLEYPGVSVDGIVLDANRRPVKGAMVRDLGRKGFALTHDDGTFTLGGPEPGTWRLQARFADQASAVKEVIVEDRPERPHVELVLGAGESNVRVAAGRGAMVFLDVDSGLLQMASTDDTGIATFHLQPPLPTRVRVAVTADGRWALGDWIDWSEAMGAPLELKMPEAGNIVLHTKGAAGPVTVTSTNGWRIDRLFQWAGAFLRLASGSDVTVTGLPTGSYTITVSNQQRTASVERDKTLEVTFD